MAAAVVCFHLFSLGFIISREEQLCFFDVTFSIEIACDSIVCDLVKMTAHINVSALFRTHTSKFRNETV